MKNRPKANLENAKQRLARPGGRGQLLACIHDQNKRGFLGGPAFIIPIRVI